MNIQPSLFEALGMVNSAILERTAPNQFTTVYAPQDWLFTLIPESQGATHFCFQHSSVYLDDFLIDAEAFWATAEDGQIQSGIWSEQIGDTLLHLEASAAYAQNSRYLLIHNVKNQFWRHQQTLQIAREQLLSNDIIVAQHDDVFNRLESILEETTNKSNHAPIHHALQHTDLGVAVLDDQLHLLTGNPALYQMFEEGSAQEKQSPEKTLLTMFETQYPEYQRVFSTGSPWSGELFWLNSPHLGRWFKVSIHSICNIQQQKRFWLLSVSDISQLKFLVKRNEKLSHYDVLTDLPNRHFFWQKLEQQITKGQAFYLLYIEIKQFKKINELHGHLIGDSVIKELSTRLKATIGAKNILARIGGTEFALIIQSQTKLNQLTELDQNDCTRLADELIEECSRAYVLDSGQRCNVGLNIGAAAFPTDADSPEDLMKYADLALFTTKKHLKSSLLFYSKALKDASRKRLELEEALRHALQNDELELFFQPIFDLRTKSVTKAEVLLRWNRPVSGLISPDEFIPLAEQSGLIVPIGKWVIEQTCQKLAQLHLKNPALTLCINLSPRQINDRKLFDFIKDCTKRYKVAPQKLELELTEGVLIDNFTKVQYLLDQVRNLGLSVSIDDFGTGYCSLSYLQKLPIDRLKIDRSFVRDIHKNENDRALVLAVIAMAHSLKLDVIAEGVETQNQSDFLQSNQCYTVQGFLYSRPLPYSQFVQLLDSKNN